MAVKPMKRKALPTRPARKPITPASSKTQSVKEEKTTVVTSTTATKTAPQRPNRKPMVPQAKKPQEPKSQVTSEAPKQPTAPATRKPIGRRAPIKPSSQVKEVTKVDEAREKSQVVPKKTEVPNTRSHSTEGKGKEATKPVTTSGRQSPPAQSRPASKGTTTNQQGRISVEAMRQMSIEDRHKLFKSLNVNPEVFVPIRKELPKKMEMRKDEAILRGIIPEKAPKVPKWIDYVGYCCYCVDWQPFHQHSWSGYKKCCGCGITTKDFYIGIDNGVFGKE